MPLDLEGAVEVVCAGGTSEAGVLGCVDKGSGTGFLSLFFVAIVLDFFGCTEFGTARVRVVF